jgi:glycosyltransferase involved in cell wall biosynthesis
MLKKVAIIGTVGIPAKYGGFETLTEYLTKHVGDRFDITVFCSSKTYKTKLKTHNNVKLKYLPLNANGVQSILYDIISIFKALFFADTLLILGVSGCIVLPFVKLISSKKTIVNIDGLEWKRAKWGKAAKWFLKYSEKVAVKYAHTVISDNKVIQDYVLKEYGVQSELIAYGADHCQHEILSKQVLSKYPFLNENYAFKVCRIEPENKLDVILKAFSEFPELNIVIVGNWKNSTYGIQLKQQFSTFPNIYLLNPIYNQIDLNQLRCNCLVYIHGHSAGGTNPSLVEAMFLGLPIIAYGVPYNRETTQHKAMFFHTSNELVKIITSLDEKDLKKVSEDMKDIANNNYIWEVIANKYALLF